MKNSRVDLPLSTRLCVVNLLIGVVGCPVLSIVLALWGRIWFAPPLLQLTPIFYLGLSIAWLPVLLTCISRHSHTSGIRKYLMLMAVIAINLSCGIVLEFVILGPLFGPLLGTEVQCKQEYITTAIVRYTCHVEHLNFTSDSRGLTFILEGPVGSPIVRLK
jgi:hypothetical protein